MTPRHVVVIGAGVAGMSAAHAAAGAGARVTVVGNEPPGGRAIWDSLLPSKVLLTVADSLGQAEHFSKLGVTAVRGAPDIPATMRRIRELSQAQSYLQSARLNRLGLQFLAGTATFDGPHELRVASNADASSTLHGDAFVIATGSVPTFPPQLRPDGRRIIAPRFIRQLDRLPANLAVIGAGPTGTEFVYAFNRLGVAVNWVVDEYGVLPTFERDTVDVLVGALEARGVVRHAGTAAASLAIRDDEVRLTLRDGRIVSTEMALVAVGRRSDVAALNLDSAGLSIDPRRGIDVDECCRSAVPHIYAGGDATGAPFIANKAISQGWTAGRHAAGSPPPPYRADSVVEAVYTDPQIAQVGLMEGRAREQGHTVRVLNVDYEMKLKAALLSETEGFMTLVTTSAGGPVLGARAVGAHAADVLAPVALGIRLKAPLEALASLFPAHPALGEIAFAAARAT